MLVRVMSRPNQIERYHQGMPVKAPSISNRLRGVGRVYHLYLHIIDLITKSCRNKIAQIVEQDALMSPNPRGKLEDLTVGCVCVV